MDLLCLRRFRYADMGGNFLDTANVYCMGESEEIVGTWLQKLGPKREEMVIATKGRCVLILQLPVIVSNYLHRF